jgi:hypothetical protein
MSTRNGTSGSGRCEGELTNSPSALPREKVLYDFLAGNPLV